jgi:hypothetical protein
MSEPNMYRCTPRRAREHVLDAMQAGLVPFLQGSPGMGKSAILRSIARQLLAWLIDHRIATSAPEDFTGLPRFLPNGKATFAPLDIFPTEEDQIPDGYNGWILLLDEFNQGTKMVQAAAYKLVLDRMVGQFKLHPNLAMCMAGNLSTDRAITNELSTAMQSRVVHIEMEVSHQEWLEDVALTEDYDERIIAFLNWKDEYLMDFRPDHQEKTFACPRTWEFVNRLIKGKDVNDDRTSLLAGTITSGTAVEFVQFCQNYLNMITLKDVLSDPRGCVLPQTADRKWMIVSHLMSKADERNFADLATYINRIDLSFRVLFFRGLLVQKPRLRSHPAFAGAMAEVNRYLNQTSQPALPGVQP